MPGELFPVPDISGIVQAIRVADIECPSRSNRSPRFPKRIGSGQGAIQMGLHRQSRKRSRTWEKYGMSWRSSSAYGAANTHTIQKQTGKRMASHNASWAHSDLYRADSDACVVLVLTFTESTCDRRTARRSRPHFHRATKLTIENAALAV